MGTEPKVRKGSLTSVGVCLPTAPDRVLFVRTPCRRLDSLEEAFGLAEADEQATAVASPQSSTDGEQFRFRVYHRNLIALRAPHTGSSWILTDWSARQLCRLYAFPFHALSRLKPKTAVEVLEDRNEWAFIENRELAAKEYRHLVPLITRALVTERRSLPDLRAIYSIAFARLADRDLLGMLIEDATDFEPIELVRGDRLLLACLRVPVELEVGDELVSPALVIRSSEVGYRPFQIWRALYRLRDGVVIPWSCKEGLGKRTLRVQQDPGEVLDDLRATLRQTLSRRWTEIPELRVAALAVSREAAEDFEGGAALLRGYRTSWAPNEGGGDLVDKAVRLALEDDAYGRRLTAWSLSGALWRAAQAGRVTCGYEVALAAAARLMEVRSA